MHAQSPDPAVAQPPAAVPTLQCPTCRTAWRSASTCPRCGTDLTALMRVALRAWELRQAARAALRAGNRAHEALSLARTACQLHATPQGQRLVVLALLVNGQVAEATALLQQLRK
jgi:hypothetical protein